MAAALGSLLRSLLGEVFKGWLSLAVLGSKFVFVFLLNIVGAIFGPDHVRLFSEIVMLRVVLLCMPSCRVG